MFKQLRKQASLRGIAAGAKATGEVPTKGTIHALFLECLDSSGDPLTRTQILTDITGDVVIRLDGETIIEASVTFLLDLQKIYGDKDQAGNVDGIIPIYFMRRNLPTDAERILYSLGMADVDSFTIDVDIAGVAVLSTINVYVLVDPTDRLLGQHVRINKFPQNFATTGDQEVTSLPKEGSQVGYLAMHIAAADVTKVTVKIGGNDIIDEVTDELNQVNLEAGGRIPQASYYLAAFDLSNDLSGFLPMANVKDFRQVITWGTAPNNYNIYTERVFGLRVKR